jgi:hypothetical protein
MLRDNFLTGPQFGGARTFSDLALGWVGKGAIIVLLVFTSALHAITLFGSPGVLSQWLVFALVAAAPGLITVVLVPGAWRRPGRWLLLLAVVFFSDPQYTYMLLIVVETWALYRTWVIEAGWRGFLRRSQTIVTRLRAGSSKTHA